MSTSKAVTVLVTGISGYLGSHVVDYLVQEGYRVKGTVRSAKVAATKDAYSIYGDAVNVIEMDDLVNGTYPGAFEDVDAVIHLAAPLAGRAASAEEAISVSVDGSVNILRQAEKAGIKNFSYISSIVTYDNAFLAGDFTKLTENQYSQISKEDVIDSGNPMLVYTAAKILSERAVWKFVDEHPHVEMTTINPPFFYGPFAPGFRSPHENGTISAASVSTMCLLFPLLQPDGAAPSPFFVDIRDVARALVAALKAPPASRVGRKRILISSEWVEPFAIVDLISKERPELAGRICRAIKEAPGGIKPVVDNKRLKEVLGLEVTPWQKTILDSVDALIQLEEEWKARGVTLAVVAR